MTDFIIILLVILCIIFVSYVIYSVIKKEKNNKASYDALKPEYQKLEKKYQEKRNYYESHHAIKNVLNEYTIINDRGLRIFHDDLCGLNFYINERDGILPEEVNEEIYSFDDIKYYQKEGSKRKEQHISGGGSSLKGAIVGGLVAGDAGAVIGSRKEIETDYVDVDDREILVTMNDGKQIELVDLECYELLLDYIPEKEYDNYINNKKEKGKKH